MINAMLSFEDQLEAHPIKNNNDLWSFNVRSINVDWDKYIYPISKRSSPIFLGQDFDVIKSYNELDDKSDRMNVFICHDMMGSYLEDRFFSSSRKFDDYRFLHWSGVDYFCYFSHQYVTIPPSNWINAAHKHGVTVLGTFITEWAEGKDKLLEVLQSQEAVNKTTDALVKCCKHFKFEGWLINIECEIPQQKVAKLLFFISSLREKITMEIPHGKVFWYDSVIETGKLSWQNSMNEKNLAFFRNSDAILLNYNWSDKHIQETNAMLTDISESKRRAFFGIDIFGRGQVAGFDTHKTLSRITNFSVGFFATGWTYEKLGEMPALDIKKKQGDKETNKAFLEKNEFFWKSLWKDMPTFPYNELPFTTFFCVGSGESFFKNGRKVRDQFFTMSAQCLQPSVPIYDNADRCFDEAVNGGSCLKILKEAKLFRLFLTHFQIERSILVSYAFKNSEPVDSFDVTFRFEDEQNSKKDCYIFMGNYRDKNVLLQGRCYLSPLKMDFQRFIIQQMNDLNIPTEIPTNLSNGWVSRYYLAFFEKPVVLKDIGTLFRRSENNENKHSICLFGGIHITSLDSRIRIQDEWNGTLDVIRENLFH
ncbi:ENGASE family protein [Megaselia abdita]